MIDWGLKIIELKAMVDEMEMWSGKTEGHLRAMLGRNADDMRAFIRQIEAELVPTERSVLDTPPTWVTDPDGVGWESEPGAGYEDYSGYDEEALDDSYPGA
jgi:hypothetical protein